MKISGAAYGELLRDLLAAGQPVVTRVRGGSMRAFIPDGAVVQILPASSCEVRVGEVVVRSRRDGSLVCHRLARRRGGMVETWGDASMAPDGWAPEACIIGRVAGISHPDGLRPITVRSPWRMTWRYVKRRLLGWLRGADAAPAVSCSPRQED